MAKKKGLLVALGLGDEATDDEDSGNGLRNDVMQAIKDEDESALGEALDAYIGDYIDGLRDKDSDDEY